MYNSVHTCIAECTESLLPAATGIQHKARLRTWGACLRARALIHLHSNMWRPNKNVLHCDSEGGNNIFAKHIERRNSLHCF